MRRFVFSTLGSLSGHLISMKYMSLSAFPSLSTSNLSTPPPLLVTQIHHTVWLWVFPVLCTRTMNVLDETISVSQSPQTLSHRTGSTRDFRAPKTVCSTWRLFSEYMYININRCHISQAHLQFAYARGLEPLM